jgi:5-formyl-3-hydroxy-2-methylpyridine 4-carboxylate dehydrogenase
MQEQNIHTVAIIGAGTMGPDVAAIFARHGLDVRLTDISAEALARAADGVQAVYRTLIEGGLMTADEAVASQVYLTITPDQNEALSGVDFVLEAIPEKLDLKRALFAEIEPKVRADTILASNSSGIPIAQIAQAAQHPGRVIGTHWLNQPHVIPVVELVRGEQTTEATLETTRQLLERLNMVPVVIQGNVPGFIHNRILFVIYREILHLLEEGLISAEDIDNVTKWAIGPKLTAIGPLEMLDVAGLDTYQNIATYLNPQLAATGEVSDIVRQKVERGEMGIKTGQGMYSYTSDEIPALMQSRRQLMLEAVRLRLREKGGGPS